MKKLFLLFILALSSCDPIYADHSVLIPQFNASTSPATASAPGLIPSYVNVANSTVTGSLQNARGIENSAPVISYTKIGNAVFLTVTVDFTYTTGGSGENYRVNLPAEIIPSTSKRLSPADLFLGALLDSSNSWISVSVGNTTDTTYNIAFSVAYDLN